MAEKAAIVVMGASGSGKSTVGVLLATALELRFVDADTLHPESNRMKMAAGFPLTDADRAPWLDAVAAVLAAGGVVVACSALRRRYRDRLRLAAPDLQLVCLQGGAVLLAERLAARRHDFMPAELLESQLTTLEPPQADERAIVVNITKLPAEIVRLVADRLQHGDRRDR
jgi:gluconokinase